MANDKLQELIETLKKQGVEHGEKAGQEIVEAARREADDILARARAEADAIVARSKDDANKQMKQLRSSMEIAASQFVNNLKGVIEENFLTIPLKKELATELSDPDFMKNLITKFVETYAAGSQHKDILLMLPRETPEQLMDFAVELMARHYGQGKGGDQLVSDLEIQNVKFGFQIDKKDGNVRLDFSDEAFLSLFLRFLSPRFRELFANIIKVGDMGKK
jgi:V/A-type H+/Na+-transporting ATPase subunit E